MVKRNVPRKKASGFDSDAQRKAVMAMLRGKGKVTVHRRKHNLDKASPLSRQLHVDDDLQDLLIKKGSVPIALALLDFKNQPATKTDKAYVDLFSSVFDKDANQFQEPKYFMTPRERSVVGRMIQSKSISPKLQKKLIIEAVRALRKRFPNVTHVNAIRTSGTRASKPTSGSKVELKKRRG